MSTAGARTERALVSPTPWLLPALPLGLALVLYAPLFPPLVREWAEFPSLSHGFAVPLIAAYLIWARRDRLRDLVPEPSFWGAPLAAIGLGGLVVGVLGSESFVARVSLPVTLFGLVLLLTGPRVARETWAGIGYLVFMIPLPWATLKLVTYRSRLLDARVSAEALGWLGVPVLRDGVMLHLPNITLEVADACSSIPAIAALTSLGVAFASLSRRPLPHRITLIAATLPLAISANIIRITSVAALAYYVGPWTLQSAYHMFNGTVNFLLTFVLLVLLDGILARVYRERRA